MTPLAQAAGKGLDNMVQLLLDNGADINYLCSVSCRFMSNLNGMISCSRNTVSALMLSRVYFHTTVLTHWLLGAHAQRGLQYLLCVSVCLSVTSLAATAFVSACNQRHLRHYFRLSAAFSRLFYAGCTSS